MYAVTSCTAKALNGGQDDILTKMVAGCASGAVFGVPSTSVPVAHTRACGDTHPPPTPTTPPPPPRPTPTPTPPHPPTHPTFFFKTMSNSGQRPSVAAGACAAFAAMAAAVHLAGGKLAPEDRKNNEFFRRWSRNSSEEHGH